MLQASSEPNAERGPPTKKRKKSNSSAHTSSQGPSNVTALLAGVSALDGLQEGSNGDALTAAVESVLASRLDGMQQAELPARPSSRDVTGASRTARSFTAVTADLDDLQRLFTLLCRLHLALLEPAHARQLFAAVLVAEACAVQYLLAGNSTKVRAWQPIGLSASTALRCIS